MQRRTAFSLMS